MAADLGNVNMVAVLKYLKGCLIVEQTGSVWFQETQLEPKDRSNEKKKDNQINIKKKFRKIRVIQ